MKVWRLAQAQHRSLDGAGGLYAAGRWHSRGRRVIYTSSHLSLALVEQLVHRIVDPGLLEHVGFVSIEINAPGRSITRVRRLPETRTESRQIGDDWLDRCKTLLLEVPSVVVPAEVNILINPDHPLFAEVSTIKLDEFRIDPRFYQR